jgi:tetratricopeptide (TPR) repeat protein
VGDFPLEAAEAVVQMPDSPSPLPDTLSLLRRRSLLDYDAASERYDLHDLARAFALARLPDERPARLRHARYYQGVAMQAEVAYREGKPLEGLALFDRERRQIVAGWGWAMADSRYAIAESRNPAPEVDQLLLDFADATAYVGDVRYDLRRERIPQLEAQAAAARRLGDRRGEGNSLGNLGNAYADLGEYQRAIETLEQHLTVAREIGDRRGEGQALGNLGIAYKNLGEYQRAIAYHEQSLAVKREIGDRRGEGNSLGNLGIAYSSLGEYQRAIDYYEQGLVVDREIGNIQGEAIDSYNLGLLYEQQGDLARAEPLIAHAAAFFAQIGHAQYAKLTSDRLDEVRAKLREGGG